MKGFWATRPSAHLRGTSHPVGWGDDDARSLDPAERRVQKRTDGGRLQRPRRAGWSQPGTTDHGCSSVEEEQDGSGTPQQLDPAPRWRIRGPAEPACPVATRAAGLLIIDDEADHASRGHQEASKCSATTVLSRTLSTSRRQSARQIRRITSNFLPLSLRWLHRHPVRQHLHPRATVRRVEVRARSVPGSRSSSAWLRPRTTWSSPCVRTERRRRTP